MRKAIMMLEKDEQEICEFHIMEMKEEVPAVAWVEDDDEGDAFALCGVCVLTAIAGLLTDRDGQPDFADRWNLLSDAREVAR